MPTTCAVVNCNSRSGRDGQKFFRLPRIITTQGEITTDKSDKRRRLWLAAINRTDMSQTTINNIRVCSDHFVSGKPSSLYEDTKPDWVPSVDMGYNRNVPADPSTDRHSRLHHRKEKVKKREAALSLLDLSSLLEEGVEDVDAEDVDAAETPQLTEPELEISRLHSKLVEADMCIATLKVENCKLKDQNECLKNMVKKMKANSQEDFNGDDDKVRYYTGLPTFVTLMSLFNLVASEISEKKNSSLNKFQKLIVTLMRLRLNLSIVDLSYRFGVGRSTISKVFLEVIQVMYGMLQPLLHWPERDQLYATMPMVFRKYFGCRITVIIDCFEIFIDRPSNMTARAQTWSNYKHHNTAKYLIGITPQGTVCFISNGWGGRVSDKHLTANSKFISKLLHGDLVLADRGFEIQDLVAIAGAEVQYPAFTRGKSQLSATEVEATRKIANVRIHVERVIGSVRQKYSILGATCPVDHLITKADDECPLLDKVVFVCCALTNMCRSVVSFD